MCAKWGSFRFRFSIMVSNMLHNKTAKSPDRALRAAVMKEMAKPRISRSARIAEQDLDTRRNPEKPSTTILGIVDKIIPSQRASQREKVHIAIDESPKECRELCIENILTDENGDDVKLKKGAQVELTITAKNVSRHT